MALGMGDSDQFVRNQVLPIVFIIGLASGFCAYTIGRRALAHENVHWNKAYKKVGIANQYDYKYPGSVSIFCYHAYFWLSLIAAAATALSRTQSQTHKQKHTSTQTHMCKHTTAAPVDFVAELSDLHWKFPDVLLCLSEPIVFTAAFGCWLLGVGAFDDDGLRWCGCLLRRLLWRWCCGCGGYSTTGDGARPGAILSGGDHH